ncbi:uncharacterized protein [Polyergus mexicanus]|uniref:uncharacterized protein n=1 Tax=Polyergus mexicanus TaxID=615972 RepID=UPI0038B5B285
MSLCPSSSHQLVAAAIAFRRARRKFPKDFGLESTVEHISGNIKAETATSCEESINQAKSSSILVGRACNSRSDHVCPASVRNGCDYNHSYSKENSISCSCCRAKNNGEDISELQDECSGGDAIDTVPSRERELFVASDVDQKNESVKVAERDRCDEASRTTDGEAAKGTKWIPQSARSTFYHHRKARCPSAVSYSNSDPVNLLYDLAPGERKDKVACGDFSKDKGKDFASTSCHETCIDLDGDAEDGVTSDARGRPGPGMEDTWMKLHNSMPHRKIVELAWRCRCEHHPRKETVLDLLKSSRDRCCDRCHRCVHHCDCFRRHCCCRQRDSSFSTNAKGCEVCGCGVRGGKAQHKSWHDQMRGENSRLYVGQCCSKEYPGIISASRERSDVKRWEKNGNENDENDDNDEDGSVAVINHKDSMCILAEKYKVGRKCRGKKCEGKVRSDDRTGRERDECNKSLTTKIIDQPESSLENAVPHDRPSVKHICRAHCECCGTAARIARNSCSRGCGRHAPPEGEFDRFKSSLNEMSATHRCSSRVPCRRVF